ncbi:YHYH protein [Falsirhodobacter algicola]|uniref:YHYH protein n=1 Tax=Falsirhodobacter algicola TaxID=2692330 RepID=A0A8J8MTU4_9RHOB|nr:YHYH protein [Falsirhodobacter algicola]QUS36337.1 YHYH protein [Falsirhodobacter algicola]
MPRALFPRLILIASVAVPGPTVFAHELPVGDGKVTDHPEAGNVYACNQNFRGNGARHVGDWFHGDTWDPLAKPHVRGEVSWPDASFSATYGADGLDVASNGLPVGVPTGEFPIAKDDPVYAYDTNPNAIREQPLQFTIPSAPVIADTPSCLSMGMIGFTVTGVAFYNALDDAGRDAAAHEVQDVCDGHPQGQGQYHYHSSSPCLPGAQSNTVVGWALDGFPILGMVDADGRTLSNDDLDACHGREEDVVIQGHRYSYAYRLTPEYPYTLGCFTGQLQAETVQMIRKAMGPPGNPNRRPRNAEGPRPD